MININRLVANAKAMYPLMEDTFSQLRAKSDTARKARSVGMTAFYQSIDQGQHGHVRTHWKVPSQTGSGKYDCVVEIHVPAKGGLFSIAKDKWSPKKFSTVLSKSNVKVHCSCPDFYWSGMKYNLGPAGKHKGNLSPNQNAGYPGEPNVVGNNLAPDIRDPKRRHVMCKHLLSIFKVFPFNAMKIMSDVKKFDNNIMTNDGITKDLDDGKRALDKDIELVEVTDKVMDDVLEPLTKATDELQKNQENEGSEELIQDRDEVEEISREIPEETSEIIDEENEERQPDVTEDETQNIIDEENELKTEPEEQTQDIIDEENNVKQKKTLEKDKEESDVSDDPNEILGK